MGVDKVGTKGGGFFHLFDWNRKSRKKLFTNGTASPEVTKPERKSYNNLPVTRLHLVGDDGGGAVSSAKDNGDYSCASSATDEDGNGIRAPGVVARLMGLETMPSAGTADPYSSPLFQPQPLHQGRYQKCSNPELEINRKFIGMNNELGAYSKKPPELTKVQRMPSSPIERFQTEVLPPKSARSVPLTNHKLLSPIKNPRFISSKDASYIMEAAAKILEPGNPNTSARTPSGGSFSHSLRVRDPKECMSSSQRTPKLPDSFKRPAESNAVRYLRAKPLSKSWNSLESDFRNCQASSLDREEVTSISAKSKGKSISLAIQAKVNVQRREGRTSVAPKEQEEFKSTQSSRSQPNNLKDRLQRKSSGSAASGVLKQNNLKQNCWSNKDKLSAISSLSHSQGRKAFSRDASSSARTKTINKPHGNSGCRRKGSQIINIEKEVSSSTVNNLSRNKRTKVDHASEKTGCVDDVLANQQEKHVRHNVIIDEQTKQCEDRKKNGMDVVSFTFTSSSVHSRGSQLINVREKQEAWKDYYPQAPRERDPPTETSNKKLSSHGLNFQDGDALSVLLEQKLQELRFGMESSQADFRKNNNVRIASTSQDVYCASENSSAMTMENEKEVSWETCTDNDSAACDSGLSTKNVRISSVRHNLQETEVLAELGNNYDALKEPDHDRLSPFSILDPSFSYDSCNSSESCDSGGNGRTLPSSILAQDTTCFVSKKISPAMEAEIEVSDYASSSLKETTWQRRMYMVSRNNLIRSKKEEEYVKEILSAVNLNSKNFAVQYTSKTLNPLLFEQIELKKCLSMRSENDQYGRVRRKVLFDCVRESLDLKIQRYFSAGYITWRKGLAVVSCGGLAEEIYKEISVWGSMGDWMVDELVDKDMSSPMGNWLDFELDAFLIGTVIENKILATLINEVVAELLNV